MKADKDYASIAEGKYPDMIAVRGDVLRHIALLQNVDIVIKHGSSAAQRTARTPSTRRRSPSGFASCSAAGSSASGRLW